MMTTSVKMERFAPFGKSFCQQHPFAGSLEEQDDSSWKPLENTSELVSKKEETTEYKAAYFHIIEWQSLL